MIDGDTVRVSTTGTPRRSYTLRLLGLDTPETRQPGVSVECGGKEATSSMLNLAFTGSTDTDSDGLLDSEGGTGVRVDLTTDPTQDSRDAFGRLPWRAAGGMSTTFAPVPCRKPPSVADASLDPSTTVVRCPPKVVAIEQLMMP